MAKTKFYQHYCPVARSLEVIGEKWSLVIVRDLLLRGSQRFTDLLRYEGGITPKWLTLRLRDLEAAGIVERDSEAGRREVWYRLTPRGRDLAPVVEALMIWGIEHALPPPLPGESIDPAQPTYALAIVLNGRHVTLPHSAIYLVRFDADRSYTMCFDGERWSVQGGESEADVRVETTPLEWVSYLLAPPEERHERAKQMRIEGTPAAVDEFVGIVGWRQTAAPAAEAVGKAFA
ncbi:MAG: winged helix-turn-helix transcriptional regulator [Dehalococcoidia bacterium]